MPNNFTNSTFLTTYYDDYDSNDHYHQILFNDGKALQARELTQSQTLVYKDMEKFANNIFKEGSVVEPGGLSINSSYEFVKLNVDPASGGGATPSSSYVGATITGGTSGIEAKILEVVAAASPDPATIYIKFNDMAGGSEQRFIAGETLSIAGLDDLVVQSINTAANPAVGPGTRASIDKGIYYVKGHFVGVESQSIIVTKYTNRAYDYIILKITEDVITVDDDTGLYDNAQGSPNLTAPGADRYRIRLTLDKLSNIEATDNHIKIAQISDGELINESTEDPTYNFPNELVAKRIFENSGDYIVKPFVLQYEEDSAASTSKIDAVVSPGTAVVQGYRVSNQTDNLFNIDRAQDTEEITGEQIASSYGNYVKVGSTAFQGVPNINTLQYLSLYDAVDKAGSPGGIGKARLRSVSENGAEGYKFHLFDIRMDAGKNFRNVQSIGDSADDIHFNITQENSKSVLYETNKNDLLFEHPYLRPINYSNIALTYQQRFEGTTDGSGNLTITVDDAVNETFINTADWVVVRSTGAPDTSFTISAGGSGSTTTTFASLDNSTAYKILAYVRKASSVAARTKTLTTSTITGVSSSTDSDGNTFFDLGKYDIFKLDSVRDTNSSGGDIKARFDLDNGQRDNFYALGRLLLKGGYEDLSSGIYAKFQHFTHGASGEFFSARSYVGQINYNQVPSHRKKDGKTVFLNDVLDFRPSKNSVNHTSSSYSGGVARVNLLPQPTDTVEADVTYYLPRKDRLVATPEGEIEYIRGVSSFDPLLPEIPPQSLNLYDITMFPFTLSDSDMDTKRIEHKRYTMRDIGVLDNRLSDLEETVSLTLLETDLANINVLDSTGAVRSKSGFFVDDFSDQTYSDLSDPTYSASIDPQEKILRPSFYDDNVRLVYDSDLSTDAVLKGDTVFIKFDEDVYLENPYATRTINVNPYDVIIHNVGVTLSPQSDTWSEKQYNDTPKVTTGGTRLKNTNGNLWNDWQWNWGGTKISSFAQADKLKVGDKTNTKRTETSSYIRTSYKKIVSEETVFEQVGERYIESTYIPWMRSRLVYFKAEGLKPNSRLYAYFDDRHVEDWVQQHSVFKRYSEDEQDFGNRYNRKTQYPFGSGPTNLVTDATGKIIGSFFIPSNKSFRFKTGTKVFKLLDVPPQTGNEFRPGTEDALQVATGLYTSTGIANIYEQDLISYRDLTVKGVTTTKNKPRPPQRDKESHFYVTSSGRVVKRSGKSFNRDRTYENFSTAKITAKAVRDIKNTGIDRDPIAQSFYVEEAPGVWITRIGIKFATKPGAGDPQISVTCQIRPLVNGYPDSNIYIQGSEVSLAPSDITTSADGTTTSYFVFDEPVYLEGQKDYAFVLLTNTSDYNVYISKTEEFVIGSTTQRVAKQPSLGSLFASQNSKTWSARQSEDITFEIQRAEFTSNTATVYLRNCEIQPKLLVENPFTIINGDSDLSGNQYVSVFQPNHGFTVSDTVSFFGADSADSASISSLSIGGIAGSNIVGAPRTVAKVDGLGYQFLVTKSGTDENDIGGGSQALATRNIPFTQVWPNIQPFLPLSTGATAAARFTTSKSFAGTETAFQKDTVYSNIFIAENNYFDNPKLVANRTNEVASLSGGRSVDIQLTIETGFSTVSPALDLQRVSLWTINNDIDKQDSASTSGFNVPIVYSPETAAYGGSSLAKHITRIVTLEETAVGIKVYLAANRPASTDFQLFFRTANSDEVIQDKDYILATELTNNSPDESEYVFKDYEYLIGGLGGQLLPFNSFQLKIVMRSTNSTKVPVFRDLRVIALSD